MTSAQIRLSVVRAFVLLIVAGAAVADDSADQGVGVRGDDGDGTAVETSSAESSEEAITVDEFDEATEGTYEDVETLTVRGSKQQGNLQTTPISASVFNMDQLDRGNIQGFESLSFSIPNFNYREVAGGASITIRGIGSLGGGPNTAFHIDGIYQANPYTASGIAFFDLEGVEVLRGPSGTQYGRNANAGALNVLTRPPSFDFEAFGDVQVGSYHEIRTRGVLNIPVVEDKLALRFSGITNRRYGFTRNLNNPLRSGDLDDDRTQGIRGQMRFQPSEDFEWTSRVTYIRDRSNGLSIKIDGPYPAGVPLVNPNVLVDIYVNAPQPNPTDPREVYLDSPTANNRNFLMANTTLAWSLPESDAIRDATLVLNGGYQQSDQLGVADADFSNAFSGGLPTGANAGPFRMIQLDITGDTKEWVAELSLEANSPFVGGKDLDWSAGLFYFGAASDVFNQTATNFQLQSTPIPVLGTGTSFSDPMNYAYSAAAFGSFDLELTDTVKLFGGLRYSFDRVTSSAQTSGLDLLVPDVPGLSFCVSVPISDRKSASTGAVMGRVGVEWQARDENMLYASFSTGSKPRTVELQRTGPGCTVVNSDPTKPESILAWEVGSRNRAFEDKLQLNASVFAYVWDDIQVTTLVETNLITQNANSAVATGFEIEGVATPLRDVSIDYFSIDTFLTTFNLGFTYSEFTDFTNGCLAEAPITCDSSRPGYDPQNWTGNQLPNSPLYTLTITTQYEQDLGKYGNLTPYFRFFYSDDIYFRASNLPRDLQPAYYLMDATLTWRNAAGNLSLEAFVNNITDEDVVSQKLISSFVIGAPTLSSYFPPRTWGVRLGLEW